MSESILNVAQRNMLRRVSNRQPGRPAYGPVLQELTALGFVYWKDAEPRLTAKGDRYLHRGDPTDAEIDAAQDRLEDYFGADWLDGGL